MFRKLIVPLDPSLLAETEVAFGDNVPGTIIDVARRHRGRHSLIQALR